MREIKGNIWDYHYRRQWIVITTNGSINRNGEAVMGRGIALQAKQRFADLPYKLGKLLREQGNRVYIFSEHLIITLPVKHNWWNRADLQLIEKMVIRLVELVRTYIGSKDLIYMVRPGCGNGGLDWKDVKPVLEKYLDDRFVIVTKN